METSINNWKTLSIPYNDKLHDALQQQHHAAQFLALVGRYLIFQEADDSNTNMEFILEENVLLGNPLSNGTCVALHLSDMNLYILDSNNETKKVISLDGKTKQTVFNELAQNIADVGVNISNFKNKLHYDIPNHPLDDGAAFSITNNIDFLENVNYRLNAKIVLNEVAQLFKQDEAIRIWPHHFDTGAFFTISKNEKGDAEQTMGIGLAIPDSMVNEPYYYLSFWSENEIIGIDKLKTLVAGKWMMPEWNGAVLKHSEIIKYKTAKEQYDLVSSFYNQGIDLVTKALKN